MTDEQVKEYQAKLWEQLQNDMAAADAATAWTAATADLRNQRRAMAASMYKLRTKQKLSQYQLAERSGLKQSVIAGIESEKINPTAKTLYKIASALGVNLLFYT